MADLQLRKVSETATTITIGWDAVPSAVGFKFTGGGKTSHTFDGTRTTVKFDKNNVPFEVTALVAGAKGSWPQATPPPPPPLPPSGVGVKPGDSWQTAYDKAIPGAVVTVLAGNHGSPTLTGTKPVTFKGEAGVVVTSLPGTAANATFENMTVDTGTEHGYKHVEIVAANITFKDIHVKGDYACIQTFDGGTNWTWDGGTFESHGKRKIQGDGEPIWLGENKATVKNVKFGAFDIEPGFHLEAIRIQSADDVTIDGCTFAPGSEAGSGHIFGTSSTPSSNVLKRLRIENCKFAPVIGSYAIQFHTNVQRYDSYVYKNNDFAQPILDPGTYVNLVACGNQGQVPSSWKGAC